jgi:hypothetical protein
MEASFSTIAQRVDASWWPSEIRQALMRGSVSELAQFWCVQWWRERMSGLEAQGRAPSALERWAQFDARLFFQVAEGLGLCLLREEVRRIIDKKRLEELRQVLGAGRLSALVTEFPSVSVSEPPPLPAKLSASFLKTCAAMGLQLGQVCAQQVGSPAQSVFRVSLPLHDEPDKLWQSSDRFQSALQAIDFLVHRVQGSGESVA